MERKFDEVNGKIKGSVQRKIEYKMVNAGI